MFHSLLCTKSHILMHETRFFSQQFHIRVQRVASSFLLYNWPALFLSGFLSVCTFWFFPVQVTDPHPASLSLSAVWSTILKLAPNLAPWLQFLVFNTQRAMLPSPTHYQHYWFLCCVICLRPKLCGQKMKSRNITNLGVEIRFLCFIRFFYLALLLQPHLLTFLFMMTLVLLSIIQAE